MSILIKGIEMPRSCYLCPCNKDDGFGFFTCGLTNSECDFLKRPNDCPIVPVPPHGRLIDADAMIDSFDPSDFWNPDAEDNCFAAIHVVNCAPTIIPASEGGEL